MLKMSSVILEVCCGSADDVIQAHKAGAHRVELNSNLFHGGLTPTIGELVVAKRETGMKIMTMVRPREGGFCYTDAEFATAVEDARQLLANGTDGLVFGFLHQDGTPWTRSAPAFWLSWPRRPARRLFSTGPSTWFQTGRKCWTCSSSWASPVFSPAARSPTYPWALIRCVR